MKTETKAILDAAIQEIDKLRKAAITEEERRGLWNARVVVSSIQIPEEKCRTATVYLYAAEQLMQGYANAEILGIVGTVLNFKHKGQIHITSAPWEVVYD